MPISHQELTRNYERQKIENMMQPVYPDASCLRVGMRLFHVEHGYGRVAKKTKKSELPYCVWLKMESDNVVGTVDIRLCRWPF